MRTILTTIVCILCLVAPSIAQEEVTDSLNTVLAQKKIPDSTRVWTLIELSSQYYRIDATKARSIATQAKELAKATKFHSGLANAYKAIGMTYYFQNNWIDALVQWKLALETFDSINDHNGVSNMLNNLGAVHFNGGDDEAALNYYLRSLKVADRTNDTLRKVTALINIGTVYLSKESSKNLALDYYQRALPLSRSLGDYDAIGTCAVNLGEIYLPKNDTILKGVENADSALYYFETALDAYRSSPTGNVPYALQNIGKVHAFWKDYDKAIKYQTEAYQLAMAMGAQLEMAQSLVSLADTYDSKGDAQRAITAFNQAKNIVVEIGALYEMQSVYRGLAKSYSDISDFKQAYSYLNMSFDLRDTLYNAEMDKKLHAQTLSYEIDKKQGQISLLEKDQELKAVELERQKTIRNGTIIFGFLLFLLAIGLYNRYTYTKRTNKIISLEKERSDELLLNILPEEVAEELKAKGEAEAVQIDKVTVLFTDFKGFTALSEQLTPKQLVKDLHECFSAFDLICEDHGMEKIKTIGDAYMAAGGLPVPNNTHPRDAIAAGLKMRDFIAEGKARKISAGLPYFEIRIGIHTGPVVAGIVGVKKFSYDIWGDTVNIASRMESSGEVGLVNMSEATYDMVKEAPDLTFTSRGKVEAKGKGEMEMYFVEGRIDGTSKKSIEDVLQPEA